jgi:hypothetical protein
VDATTDGVAVGFATEAADIDGQLGGGSTASQWGLLLSNGYFYYRDTNESAGYNTGLGAISPSIIGVLLDFDDERVTYFSDGAELFNRSVELPAGVKIYPAAHLDVGATDVELFSVAPFNYVPELTFVGWDKPDKAIGSRVSGTVRAEGSPAKRNVRAFSYGREVHAINNFPKNDFIPLGSGQSDLSTGEYDIILHDGYDKEVIVFAFDEYGSDFTPDASVVINDRIHPSAPSGYVFECTGAGTLPSAEPDPWPTDVEGSHLIGTASFVIKPFYKPEAHGPVTPEFVEVPADIVRFRRTIYFISHGLVVLPDGTVTGWGSNSNGQANPPAGLSEVISVCGSQAASFALKTDGTIVSWGSTAGSQRAIPGGITNAIQIDAGYIFGVILRADGTVTAWGDNGYGQVSGAAGLANIKEIATGYQSAVAVRYDGTVAFWGRDIYSIASHVAALTDVVSVAFARGYWGLALKSDGTVAHFGQNNYAQASIPAGATDVVQIVCGDNHAYALKKNGTLVGWGQNNSGQRTTPAGLPAIANVQCGASITIATDYSGNTYRWGNTSYVDDTPPFSALISEHTEI